MIRRDLLVCLVLSVGLAACTRHNPAYCLVDTDCGPGKHCTGDQPPRNSCVSNAAGADGGTGAGGAAGAGGKAGAAGSVDASDARPADGGNGDGSSDASEVRSGCTANAQCADGGAKVCDVDAGGVCVGCLARGDCTGTTPACDTSAKTCVGCLVHGDCTGTTPACDTSTKTCVGCLVSGDCMGATPACDTSAKTCVECLTSADCTLDPTRPICDTTAHTCGKCTSDSQCVAKLGADPGVCMAHQDGRCATTGETIFVENSQSNPTCNDSANVGTASQPFCEMQPVAALLMPSRALVVVRGTVSAGNWAVTAANAAEVSVLGQQSAFMASGASPAFSITGGAAYLRGMRLSSSASMGLSATGGTLRLDTITVDSCPKGGLLLDGAAFDIRNTTVTNNGPGQTGPTPWGGILVNTVPTGSKQVHLLTIQGNKQIGMTCASGIMGDGVFATGNTGGDVASLCGVTTCAAVGPTCGAQ